jgi:ParB family chromosome partitioning protein
MEPAPRRHPARPYSDEIRTSDKRVLFVGIGAYMEAGGAVRQDLFDDGVGYVPDPALLDRLVE